MRAASQLARLFIVALTIGCNNYNLLDQLENPGSKQSSCGSDCRIFVTANTFSGNMGGVSGADNHCRFDPANPDGSGRGNWKAMLASNSPVRRACLSAACTASGAAENVDWALRPNTSYKRPDGTPIGTTSGNGIFQNTLTNSIGTSAVDIWTGLDVDWVNSSSLTCNNWTDDITASLEGTFGTATGVMDDAIVGFSAFCVEVKRLYCVEQ